MKLKRLSAINAQELKTLNDKKDDTNTLTSRPEVNNRDATFMYYDGEVYIEDGSLTHSELISRVSKSHNLNEQALQQARQGFVDIDGGLAFGHIINDCAFIDDVTIFNAYPSEVSEVLQSKCDKVYLLSNKLQTKRLARLK